MALYSYTCMASRLKQKVLFTDCLAHLEMCTTADIARYKAEAWEPLEQGMTPATLYSKRHNWFVIELGQQKSCMLYPQPCRRHRS